MISPQPSFCVALTLITERVSRQCCQNLSWKADYARRVAEAYSQFLRLKVIVNDFDAAILIPCIPVNIMWQQHILDTKHYATDCFVLFGRWIHHDFSCGFVIDNMNSYAQMMSTLRTLQKFFGSHVDRELWGFPTSAFVADCNLTVHHQQQRARTNIDINKVTKTSICSDMTVHRHCPQFSDVMISDTSSAMDSILSEDDHHTDFRVVSPTESSDTICEGNEMGFLMSDCTILEESGSYSSKTVSIATMEGTTPTNQNDGFGFDPDPSV